MGVMSEPIAQSWAIAPYGFTASAAHQCSPVPTTAHCGSSDGQGCSGVGYSWHIGKTGRAIAARLLRTANRKPYPIITFLNGYPLSPAGWLSSIDPYPPLIALNRCRRSAGDSAVGDELGKAGEFRDKINLPTTRVTWVVFVAINTRFS